MAVVGLAIRHSLPHPYRSWLPLVGNAGFHQQHLLVDLGHNTAAQEFFRIKSADATTGPP